MRILDENNIEIENPDFAKGYLVEEEIFVRHHESIEAVEEIGHFKVVKEYPNGGKDVEFIVDTPAVEAKEAWDEYETIQRFVPYTEEALTNMRIGELKGFLFDTDYNILKIVEGAATLKECAEVIAKRAAWRKEINELEEKLR